MASLINERSCRCRQVKFGHSRQDSLAAIERCRGTTCRRRLAPACVTAALFAPRTNREHEHGPEEALLGARHRCVAHCPGCQSSRRAAHRLRPPDCGLLLTAASGYADCQEIYEVQGRLNRARDLRVTPLPHDRPLDTAARTADPLPLPHWPRTGYETPESVFRMYGLTHHQFTRLNPGVGMQLRQGGRQGPKQHVPRCCRCRLRFSPCPRSFAGTLPRPGEYLCVRGVTDISTRAVGGNNFPIVIGAREGWDVGRAVWDGPCGLCLREEEQTRGLCAHLAVGRVKAAFGLAAPTAAAERPLTVVGHAESSDFGQTPAAALCTSSVR
jgi:hypothetical protein